LLGQSQKTNPEWGKLKEKNMLRNFIQYAIYKEARNFWFRSGNGDRYFRILGRTPVSLEFSESVPAALSLPLVCSRPDNSFRSSAEDVDASATGSIIGLELDGLTHEGEIKNVPELTKFLESDGEVVTNDGLNAELAPKAEDAINYLKTDPWRYWQDILPFSPQAIEMILADDLLYNSLSPVSRVKHAYLGEEWVPLGVWAEIWKERKANHSCPECGGEVFVIACSRGMSMGSSSGVCSDCKQVVSLKTGEPWGPAYQLTKDSQRDTAKPPYRFDIAVREIKQRLARL
jgi:predicted RNA-binding Zn-ribbon protein involved in translation (DUF1610 family)